MGPGCRKKFKKCLITFYFQIRVGKKIDSKSWLEWLKKTWFTNQLLQKIFTIGSSVIIVVKITIIYKIKSNQWHLFVDRAKVISWLDRFEDISKVNIKCILM